MADPNWVTVGLGDVPEARRGDFATLLKDVEDERERNGKARTLLPGEALHAAREHLRYYFLHYKLMLTEGGLREESAHRESRSHLLEWLAKFSEEAAFW